MRLRPTPRCRGLNLIRLSHRWVRVPSRVSAPPPHQVDSTEGPAWARACAFLSLGLGTHPAFQPGHLSPTAALAPAGCLQWCPGSPGPTRSTLPHPVHVSSHPGWGGNSFSGPWGAVQRGLHRTPPPGLLPSFPQAVPFPQGPAPWSLESPHWPHPLVGVGHRKGLGRLFYFCVPLPPAPLGEGADRELACESGPSARKTSLGQKGQHPSKSSVPPQGSGPQPWPGGAASLGGDTCTDPVPHHGPQWDLPSR